jgi:hypothetical protein
LIPDRKSELARIEALNVCQGNCARSRQIPKGDHDVQPKGGTCTTLEKAPSSPRPRRPLLLRRLTIQASSMASSWAGTAPKPSSCWCDCCQCTRNGLNPVKHIVLSAKEKSFLSTELQDNSIFAHFNEDYSTSLEQGWNHEAQLELFTGKNTTRTETVGVGHSY